MVGRGKIYIYIYIKTKLKGKFSLDECHSNQMPIHVGLWVLKAIVGTWVHPTWALLHLILMDDCTWDQVVYHHTSKYDR